MNSFIELDGQALGLDVGSTGATFLAVLAVHVAAGVVCVACGAAAALARKGPARHARLGRWYYRCVVVVFSTAVVMAGLRWPDDNYLAGPALITMGAAAIGVRARRATTDHRPHLTAMGASYLGLLTAFYVDNGPHLPLWNHLPPAVFWVAPTLIGAPLILRARRAHQPRHEAVLLPAEHDRPAP
jgi:hypothetical protein